MSIFIFTEYQCSCRKVMFSAVCVCHSVYRRGWVSTQGPDPSPLSLFQFQPYPLYHTGSPTQTCSNLCNLGLTIQGPSGHPLPQPVQTCSLCSAYICRHAGCWHSTEVPSCFFCAFVSQLLQENIFIEYIYVLKVFNIKKKTLILMIFGQSFARITKLVLFLFYWNKSRQSSSSY